MHLERWRELMRRWNAPESDGVYSELVAAYSESHRHYHAVQHIDDCLVQFDGAAAIAKEPHEVELALWFHDAVYEPASSSNEHESAERARAFMSSFGAPDERTDRVCRHILATRHDADPISGDTALVVDVDLSILGRERGEFERYERDVREEYRWIPASIYRRKRIEILRSFLNRSAIYATEHFRSRYETTARENLEWSIQRLNGKR